MKMGILDGRNIALRWSMSRTWWVLLFSIVPLIFGLIALWLGKDVSWDLKNYHYYNAYAFLNDRMGFDIAPAMRQSYFNPFIDIPFYLLMVTFPAWVVTFTLGTLHGINFSIVFAITWCIASGLVPYKRALLSLLCAAFGCLAPGFLWELGGTHHDLTLSVLVLTAVLLLVLAIQNIDVKDNRRVYLLVGIAGFVMGAAVALKLTNSVYAVGSAVGLFFMVPTWRWRFKIVLIYGCFGMAAVLLIAGPWWWLMWDRFQNPLFPYFPDTFDSAALAEVRRRATSLRRPNGLLEHIGWPVVFSENSDRVHGRFRDVRFAVVWLTYVIYFISASVRLVVETATRPKHVRGCFDSRSGDFLFVFFGATFVAWMLWRPGVYRYIIPLELLVPLVFFILIEKFGLSSPHQLRYGIVGVLIIMVFFKPAIPRQRSPDWTARYIEVDTSFLSDSDSSAVIMLGGWPMSYVIPAFPSSVRFLRPEGNLRLRNKHELMKKIKRAIATHEGPLFVIAGGRVRGIRLEQSAARYSLAIDTTRCMSLNQNLPGKPPKLCPVTRR